MRAGDAQNGAELLGLHVADFKNTGLLGLHEKHGFIGNLGVHRGGHRHFKQAVSHRRGIHTQLNIHAGLLLVQQNVRRIRLLQRHVLEVNALDLEYGVKIGFSHGELSGYC